MLPTYGRVLAALCALATTATAVVPVEVKGRDFVNSKTGDRFQVMGVDYQPGGTSGFTKSKDPLSDPKSCLRDAALMQRLGINTIRIYNLSPEADHDECVSIFNAAGIYMILDVNSPLQGGSLDRTDPEGTYNAGYFEQVFGIVEAFKDFPNLLGFFAGNEVINEQSVKKVPAYIRAVQRDIKDYIKEQVDRSIPVGYSAADVRPILVDTVNYMMCEDKDEPNASSDFFGLNSYSWCGDATFKKAGYDILTEDFSKSSIPVFFSEYGCNAVKPRKFSEVQAIYGDEMSQSFSGGLVYEYTMEDNEYGLVKIKDNGDATLLVDYENLMEQYAKLDMKKVETAKESQTGAKAPKCGEGLIKNGTFLKTFDLPKRPSKVQDMIDNGLKNAKTGKLVDVSSAPVEQTIFDHNGKEVKGISLKALSEGETNAPGKHTSGKADSKSEDEESAAGVLSAPVWGLVSAAALATLLL
ncbi:1,3-beta-glucanosyltransferase gel2 [Aspergillus candidus]|uniref:1,3-beta-glucanosyltransferase n=1 Tax=Aspergillus candidus TaxID=41067 RepID=A0A2I2EZ40_ASPCN|nr:1,3-beta-glucanosyltransferase gel2 [Aspergillus candidus]PLB33657.1 1,3-beta-glucanosyltransferase gel2 [Aspergillus candidus]